MKLGVRTYRLAGQATTVDSRTTCPFLIRLSHLHVSVDREIVVAATRRT